MQIRKPNILFLIVDDLRPQLGCYGHANIATPNIDRLAAEGVRFSRAYCQVPVCGASRASVLSGVRPTRERFLDYRAKLDDDLPGTLTLPEHFRKHGYVALSDGKVFHHQMDSAERSWNETPWRPNKPGEPWQDWLLPGNQPPPGSTERGPAFECADVPGNAYYDGKTTEQAIQDLRRLKREDAPWFLAVGLIKPHLPFNAPKRYWDYYKREEVNLADNPFPPDNVPAKALHPWGELRNYRDVPKQGPVSDELARSLIHGYYAATSYTDAQLGRVLEELDRLDLASNTVVMLWGDHGWQLGEHGLWCKHCNFNTSLNAPLIVRHAGMSAGAQSPALVEFVDMYPTLCDLAGLPLPDHLEGNSLVPLLHGPDRPWRPAAFSRYFAGDSVRTDRHLYTQWKDNEGALRPRNRRRREPQHRRTPPERRPSHRTGGHGGGGVGGMLFSVA